MFASMLRLHTQWSSQHQPKKGSRSCVNWILIMVFVTLVSPFQSFGGQRSFDIGIIGERLELKPYFRSINFHNHSEVISRAKFLRDSLELDSNQMLWQRLLLIEAKALFFSGHGQKAQAFSKRIIALTQDAQDSYRHHMALLQYSFTLPLDGAENELKYLFATVEKAAESNDLELEFDLCMHITDMYIDLNRRDIAREWHDRGAGILPKVYSAANCHIFHVIGADVNTPKERDEAGRMIWPSPEAEKEAFDFIHKAIECGKQAQAENDAQFINIPLGYHIRATFWRTPEEHVSYFRKTLGESQKKKDAWAIFWGQMRLVTAYLTADFPDTAGLYLDSIRAFTVNGGLTTLSPYYNTSYAYYQYLGNSDSMLHYLRLKYEIEKEMAANQTLVDIEKNKDKYYDARQKIIILEQEAQLAESKRKRRNLYIAIAFFSVVALLLTVLVIRIRSSNKVIKAFAEEQQENAKEKTVLMQEINHRVKNNLQMIITFIEMQEFNVSEKETTDFAEGIRSRVKAVSLVHELMMAEDRLTGISFEEYTKGLIKELGIINYASDEIEAHVEMDEVAFGLTTTMHLGIMLNELISNSIKHSARRDGLLEIWVGLIRKDDVLHLSYSDSGKDIPNIVPADFGDSLGLYIVSSMVRQMRGSVLNDENNDGGITLEFPVPRDTVPAGSA